MIWKTFCTITFAREQKKSADIHRAKKISFGPGLMNFFGQLYIALLQSFVLLYERDCIDFSTWFRSHPPIPMLGYCLVLFLRPLTLIRASNEFELVRATDGGKNVCDVCFSLSAVSIRVRRDGEAAAMACPLLWSIYKMALIEILLFEKLFFGTASSQHAQFYFLIAWCNYISLRTSG